MKDYLANTDSLLGNSIINPAWPEQNRPLSWINKIVVHHEAQFRPHDYANTPRYVAEANYQNNTSIPGSKGIQYHAHIDNQGTITWLRPLTTILWHCGNLEANNHSIAVCVDGNLTEQQPTREQFEALKQLLNYWSSPESGAFPADQSTVFPHRFFSATNCCGDNLVEFVNQFRETRGTVAIPDVAYDWPEYQPQAAPVEAPQPVPAPVPVPQTTPTPKPAPTPSPAPTVPSPSPLPSRDSATGRGVATTVQTLVGLALAYLTAALADPELLKQVQKVAPQVMTFVPLISGLVAFTVNFFRKGVDNY